MMNDSRFLLTFTKILSLSAFVGVLGCDAAEPDAPAERDAVLVLEVDGDVVEDIAVNDPLRVESDLLDLDETRDADACEGPAMDLVLEIDGDPVASAHGCAGAPVSGPDSLTAEPDVQAAPWCDFCDQSNENDCFSCCKCDGGSTYWCQLQCWP